jgi:hypothetical protein
MFYWRSDTSDLIKLRVQYGNESLDKDNDKVGMRKRKLSINIFTSFDFLE